MVGVDKRASRMACSRGSVRDVAQMAADSMCRVGIRRCMAFLLLNALVSAVGAVGG